MWKSIMPLCAKAGVTKPATSNALMIIRVSIDNSPYGWLLKARVGLETIRHLHPVDESRATRGV
jgi:hypothetical protein